jgi:hypothetical protein
MNNTYGSYKSKNIMIEIKRLHRIQICIPPGKKNIAREFYTKILGLREIPKPTELISNGGLWYQAGDIQFHIGVDNEINESKSHPAFEVINLDIARQHLAKNQLQLRMKLKSPGKPGFHFLIHLITGSNSCRKSDLQGKTLR